MSQTNSLRLLTRRTSVMAALAGGALAASAPASAQTDSISQTADVFDLDAAFDAEFSPSIAIVEPSGRIELLPRTLPRSVRSKADRYMP